MVIMWVLHFAPTYKCAYLNCHAGIAFKAPTYSVWIRVIMWVLHFAPTYNVHI